tara:strand:- start:5085 stop:5213 length:129 start_codon:yes stop_codon:yes gene_type:complete
LNSGEKEDASVGYSKHEFGGLDIDYLADNDVSFYQEHILGIR